MIICSKKILIFHENQEERGRLGLMLSRFGHEVHFFSSSINPETLCQSANLIIVNDKLLGQTGLGLVNQLSVKQREKIIFLLENSRSESLAELKSLQVYEWILQPVDPLKLAVVVCDYFVEQVENQETVLENAV